jgi:T3SS negative regulator,GrlR
MDDGKYKVTISTGDGTVAGMVTVASGRFAGGGEGYAVTGRVISDTAGVVEVSKDDDATPVLGLFKHVTVSVSIVGQPKAFRMAGQVNGHHVIRVRLDGAWIAELPLQPGATKAPHPE